MASLRATLAGLLLLAAPSARAACTDPQDILEFEQAAHRQLACELADRLLREEGCERSAVPECGAVALEQLAELVPGGFGDRLLASWGTSGAGCRVALARASELYLHELLTRPAQESAQAPTHPHASGGGNRNESGGGNRNASGGGNRNESGGGHPHAAAGGADESAAQQALSELEQACDGVDVGLRAIVAGPCAMLAEWGDVLDGPRLRGCLTQALGRIAEEVKPGSSRRPSASGHGGRPVHGGGRPNHAGQRPNHAGQRPNHAGQRPNHAGQRPGRVGQRPGQADGPSRDDEPEGVEHGGRPAGHP